MSKITLIALILLLTCGIRATTFTEWYVQTGGNNLNAGSTPDNSPTYTAAGGFWTNATGVWRKDGQDLSGVTNGAWASVYPDATTVNPVFIGRITNVTTTNIWISLTAKAGTSPANDTAGATTIRVGGAWSGPNTNQNPSCTHPFNFIALTMTNASANPLCLNVKEGVYSTTNAISCANNGAMLFSGYTTTPRDGGKATIDGTFGGTAYVLFATPGQNITIQDFIFQNNGSVDANVNGIALGQEGIAFRCVVRNMARNGFAATANSGTLFLSCEAYNCNTKNATGKGGFADDGSTGCMFLNCFSHDNLNANASGFVIGGSASSVINSVSHANGADGFTFTGGAGGYILGCDAFFNTGNGINISAAATVVNMMFIENCNLLQNGKWGISSNATNHNGLILNCGFGTVGQVNSWGAISTNIVIGGLSAMTTNNLVLYAPSTTPWIDPDNDNFTIRIGSEAQAKGYATFLQLLVNSPTNTVGFPDIGAAQSASTNATTRATSFSQ